MEVQTKPKRISERTLLAHHEAGHAVISAAISDAPRLISIIAQADSNGRSHYRMDGRPERLVQVHLAGFAAEELLSGQRSSQFSGPELGFSVLAATEPAFEVPDEIAGRDQHLAVQEILRMGCKRTSEAIRSEIDRFYGITLESLSAIWPAAVKVAESLLKHSELDREGFFAAVGGIDLYAPVFAVQERHGLRFKK